MSQSSKDSGLGWAPKIPRRWDVAKVCLVARLESGHTPSRQHPEYWVPEECTIPWFSLADVWQLREANQNYLGETSEKISPLGMANSAARLLPAGTVVLSRTASVGFSGIMPRPMATTQDFANWICGPRLLPEYLLWAFRAMKDEFGRAMMGSTHQTIYMPDIRRLTIPVPPITEQRCIAELLNRKTSGIDALIEKSSHAESLLALARRSVIQRAVTETPEVPSAAPHQSWAEHRFKHEVWFQEGPGIMAADFAEQGVPLLRIRNVQTDPVTLDGCNFLHEDDVLRHWRHFRTRRGDLIVSASASTEGASEIGQEAEGAICYTGLIRMRPASARLLHSFLKLWIQSDHFQRQITLAKTGATIQHFGPSHLRQMVLPVPSPDAQELAVRWANARLLQIDSAVSTIRRRLDLLREYRQALITSAVAGQLDTTALEAA